MRALSSGLVMSAAAAVLVMAGIGDASALGRGGGGSGVGGRSFGGGQVRVSGRNGFGRVGGFGIRGRIGFGFGPGARGLSARGFAGHRFDRFARGCRFGGCGSRYGYGFGSAGYGFDGYGFGSGSYGGYYGRPYGQPSGGFDQGIPASAGIRPSPVLPPAIYVIGARSGSVGARTRGAGRGRSSSVDTAEMHGESGVMSAPRITRTNRDR